MRSNRIQNKVLQSGDDLQAECRCTSENLSADLDQDILVEGQQIQKWQDGELISWTSVRDLSQQFHTSHLRMGGIAFVGTREQYRKQGHSRQVMQNALRYMYRSGYDVTMLYGIPRFYHKFGYVPAFPDVQYRIDLKQTQSFDLPKSVRWVSYRKQYQSDLLKLYHQHIKTMIGPTRRDRKTWSPNRKGLGWKDKALCYVALNTEGKIVGYMVRQRETDKVRFLEMVVKHSRYYADFLAKQIQIGKRLQVSHLLYHLPEDDAFMQFCQPLGLEKTVRYRADGDAMVRLLNVRSSLTKIAPLLQERLPSEKRGLNLITNLDDVSLTWADGILVVGTPKSGLANARIPQSALAQMLYGYSSASALEAIGCIKASRKTLSLLETLFPQNPHFHYCADMF